MHGHVMKTAAKEVGATSSDGFLLNWKTHVFHE